MTQKKVYLNVFIILKLQVLTQIEALKKYQHSNNKTNKVQLMNQNKVQNTIKV